MPCNSDYMEANGFEIEISRVACLLDELNGKSQIDKSHWRGYHPQVYSKGIGKPVADSMVRELCDRLSRINVTEYSLEMQIWWRDHKRADKERLEREMREKHEQRDRQAALAKLSDYERRLLGL